MELKLLEQDGVMILLVEGRVDTITATELEKKMSQLWSINSVQLVLDCAGMEYLCSSGLRVILTAHKQVTANEGRFVLRNITPEVRSVLDMTGISRIISIE
ncbi:MAG: STAS domain-containing protein [Bacteroidaceae bacterium]|nr:STAS domain-containing protein [Bacteroidaceae bacterium]